MLLQSEQLAEFGGNFGGLLENVLAG